MKDASTDMDLDTTTVILYSENFGNELLKNLHALWQDDQYCDVTLKVGDDSKLIRAHRVVLCSGSNYFSTMLSSGLRECNQDEPIEIQSVDPNSVEILVKFIYTGEVELNQKTVEPVLYAADLFDIPEAVNLCCRFLMRSLSPYNALYTLRLADRHSNKELYDAALKIVSAQFTEVVKSPDFLSSPPNQVADLLRSDDLETNTEIPVLQAGFLWLKSNNFLREYEVSVGENSEEKIDVEPLGPGEVKVLQDIVDTIRFPLLPLKYLQGLQDDVVAEVCPDKIKHAIKQRKSLPQLREAVKLRKGMHYGKLYVVGGSGSSLAELSQPKLKMEVYDPTHEEWCIVEEPSFMAQDPHVGSLAYLDGYLYVIGGADCTGQPGRSVHRMDIITREWCPVTSLPYQTTKPGVTTMKGKLYVAGGWDGAGPSSNFIRYDPNTGVWTRLRNMNRSRMEFQLVNCRGKLYAICGNTADRTHIAQSVEVYDEDDNGWSEVLPTIRARWFPGATVVKEFIFICGLPSASRAAITKEGNNSVYTVERYSPDTGQWNVMPALANPVAGAGLAGLNNTLYVLGGSDGTAPLASCTVAQRYDVDLETWKSISSMNVSRVGASIAVT